MTDLDNTQIITADESLVENSSTIDTEASLKIISGADSNIYPIEKETIIGRASPSDLIISASSLSKQHAKINYNNGQYFITDLGSSNKTFHNKIQLQPHVCYALHDGDEVKLGDIICSFQEQKRTNTNTLSEPTYQSYIPAVNTLVEEDSPWPLDDDIPSSVITESNDVDVIPSTQTITDSYDDQEPTQPMKIWNGNRLSRTSVKNSDDVTPKQNGLNESSSSNKSSSFIPSSNTNDSHDDDSLVIGSTTLPATIPIVIESTQLNNNDQLEIVSSTQTKRIIQEEEEEDDDKQVTIETTTVEIVNTQAYTLEPTEEVIPANNLIADTQPYELESEQQIITDVIETKCEEVHKVVINGDTIEEITTTTTTTTSTSITENENPQIETLAYDLQPTTTTVTENENIQIETLAYDLQPTAMVTENVNPPIETLAYDLQPTNEQLNLDTIAPAVCDDTQAYSLDEEIEESSPRPASERLENIPVSKLAEQLEDAESLPDDTTSKQQVEIIINQDIVKEAALEGQMDTDPIEIPVTIVRDQPATTIIDEKDDMINKLEDEMAANETEKTTTIIMEQETAPDLNKSFTVTLTESEQKTAESSPATEPDEVPLSIADAEGDEEEEEIEESAPVSGRGQHGVARRNVRRARGRRGGATRARVISTRIHGGRRNAVLPPPINNEGINTTLEETVNTETEESPKKSIITPEVEEIPTNTQPITPAPIEETPSTSQANLSSNVRVSARIKARASSGRNRQFPYTDDYVDLDDLEKQSKSPNTTGAITARKSTRGGARGSSIPQKRISLRQQPIDASESSDEKNTKQKETNNVYEQMDTGGENEEPILSTKTVGRKRKSTTPVASTITKRTRPTTPQTVPTANTRRKQTSNIDQPSLSEPITPKRGRKPTKVATPTDQSPEKASAATDRPVRIALSSHLNFDPTHLDTLRKLGFEIMDESCRVDALVVDRIRRTKKFFMCLARGAHILSPTWIEAMIKENRYIPYDKYYLEDTNAETRYGFQLRESVRLAKQHAIFENYKIFCTKDTSPPYDDIKDIIEAAGGKFIDKINLTKPGKDLICIVAQIHKNEYEDLYKKGVPIVSEEFALSGISKQKLDFESFSLFQNVATAIKPSGSK